MASRSVKFKKGDWVAEKDNRHSPHFGQVKDIIDDKYGLALNIVMYTWNGERVGRHSPPEGGPTSFEPACSATGYAKIERPNFPLDRDRTTRAYGHCLKFI